MGRRRVAGMLKLMRFFVFCSWPPIPQLDGCGTREPCPPSSAARSSPPQAGSAPAVYFRPLALGFALPIVATLAGGDGAGQAGHHRLMARQGFRLFWC